MIVASSAGNSSVHVVVVKHLKVFFRADEVLTLSRNLFQAKLYDI